MRLNGRRTKFFDDMRTGFWLVFRLSSWVDWSVPAKFGAHGELVWSRSIPSNQCSIALAKYQGAATAFVTTTLIVTPRETAIKALHTTSTEIICRTNARGAGGGAGGVARRV